MAGRVLTRFLLILGIGLYHLGLSRLVRRLGRNSPKILLYHEIAPAESDYTAGLNSTTAPELFGRHLDYLRGSYTVVGVEDVASGRAPAGAVAITFDDGYRSVYTGAFPLLSSRDLPATVYLIADAVDNRSLVWVNELNHFLRVGGPPAASRAAGLLKIDGNASPARIVDHCRIHYDPATVDALLAHLRADATPGGDHAYRAQLYLSSAEIREMAAKRITFGNHTCTHPNLERLSNEEQAAEIGEAQRRLNGTLPIIPSLAYPFGHHGADTAAIAAQAGLTSVAEVGGFNRRSAPARLGRVHLSTESVAALFARMEVVEPVKGLLRDFAQRSRRRGAAAQTV